MARTHTHRRKKSGFRVNKKMNDKQQTRDINKLKKEMRLIVPGIQHKHLVLYENFGITTTPQNLPLVAFTDLYGEGFPIVPASIPPASLRENNKIMLKSVNARLQFYPDPGTSQDYYQFRVLICQIFDHSNLANTDGFQLDNFLSIPDATVAYNYTHGYYRSRINNPATEADACEIPYKVLVDKMVTMRTGLGDANNSSSMSNAPMRVNVGYSWKNGLQCEYASDNLNSCVSNNIMLHVASSCLFGGARPSVDVITKVKWNEV